MTQVSLKLTHCLRPESASETLRWRTTFLRLRLRWLLSSLSRTTYPRCQFLHCPMLNPNSPNLMITMTHLISRLLVEFPPQLTVSRLKTWSLATLTTISSKTSTWWGTATDKLPEDLRLLSNLSSLVQIQNQKYSIHSELAWPRDM